MRAPHVALYPRMYPYPLLLEIHTGVRPHFALTFDSCAFSH